MQIGEPQRVIVVEPLVLPAPLPRPETEPEPEPVLPKREPEKMPVP
jgi:hypothetical protein